jgi:hypothetical protein
MRNHFCPTVPTALLFTAMNLISPPSPGAPDYTNSAEATLSSAWRTIAPPKENVEIVYSGGFEFEIKRLGKSGAPVPRIDAESGKVK